ncbi:hypothetical protein BpHYR1_014123 [Brachionus plicatilis]|uniref:Uncharacterized protein n=1 Tax=Brachionus plicatilis TaxID=10195 RepID=A0A3M7SDK9_BRAPC|nr:hypothetical protein BpHYR1_014123 [Brachionus plicatilis]
MIYRYLGKTHNIKDKILNKSMILSLKEQQLFKGFAIFGTLGLQLLFAKIIINEFCNHITFYMVAT